MNTKNKKTTKSIVLNKNNLNKKEELPLSNPIYNKENFKDFCELETDWNIKSVKKEDLPSELGDETCEFIDLFRRKTANEKTEWNFYIDYEKNEIIHCFHGKATEVRGWINTTLMKNRNILSIHNHITGSYSAPSAANFEILDHNFENFEIICAENEYWILEAKGKFNFNWICDVKKEIYRIFKKCDNQEGVSNDKILTTDSNKLYEKELKIFINNLKANIKLDKKEYT